jgi:hypothetical protein
MLRASERREDVFEICPSNERTGATRRTLAEEIVEAQIPDVAALLRPEIADAGGHLGAPPAWRDRG